MKNQISIVFVVLLFSCNSGPKLSQFKDNPSLDEKVKIMNEYLAPDVTINDQRPMPNVLSEQEILLKAAEYAINDGALNESYYLYKSIPELLTAKAETPILLHSPDGIPCSYMLTAVDNTGTCLFSANVDCAVNSDKEFVASTMEPLPNREPRLHIITKREVKDFANSKFPDMKITEPIAIMGVKLENSRFSHMGTFWYFKASDLRSISSTSDEYLLDAIVSGYTPAMTNGSRAIINSGYGGSPFLNWARLVKLTTPLNPQIYDSTTKNIMPVNNNQFPLKYIPVSLD